MKRKNSQIDPEHPPPSFPRGFQEFRSSLSRLNAAGSRETHDISRTKRVRFTGVDNDKLPEASERSHAPRSDDPKTSEYAFFKKLKEDAGHRFHSHLLDQDKNQSNKFQSRTESKERTNIIKHNHQEFRSSSIIENVTRDNFVPFLSPFHYPSKKPDMKTAGTTLEGIHHFQENMEEYGNILRTGGVPGELFARKRQKLRQWVADTSFPEIDELCSKGYDFVSVLVGRLLPQSKEDKCFKALKTGQVKADTKSNLLTYPKSDIQFKNFHQMPTRNLLELECGPSFDFDLSSCWLEKPGDREFSNSNSPACCYHKTYLDNRIMELDCESRERTVLCTEGESAFGFHSEKYGSLTLNDLREKDEYHYPNESLCGREPPFLLGWDFNNMTDKKKLSVNCQNTGLSVYPILSSSWDDDQKQNLESRLVSALSTPSLLSYHPQNLPSLWCSSSASNSSHNFGEQFLEVKNDIVPVLNNLSLPLSCIRDHLNLTGKSNCDCKGSSIFLSPQNHLWFMSKVLHEEHHHPCAEPLFSLGIDFDLGQKFLTLNGSSRDSFSSIDALEFAQNKIIPLSFLTKERYSNFQDGLYPREINNFPDDMVINNFPEDMVNVHNWPSFYLQRPIDKKKACSLLLDKSNWDGSDFPEDMVNIHDWPYFYLQRPIDKKKTCPLLFDKSHWDGSEAETHSEDSEVKYF